MLLKAGAALFSAAKQVVKIDKNATAFKAVGKYWDDGLAFLSKNVSDKFLSSMDIAGTTSSVLTLGMAEMAGQADGGITDFISGVGDLGQEQFSDEGGTQSGTRATHLGKIAQNIGLTIFSLMPKGKLITKIGKENLGHIYKGIAGWQASTVASDWIWDDHAGMIEDTSDTIGGLASAGKFARLLAVL